jgi:hypothetical protein
MTLGEVTSVIAASSGLLTAITALVKVLRERPRKESGERPAQNS